LTQFCYNKIFLFVAKKLPKNEQSGSASTSGQGRRLVESDGQKAATGNCCKWLSKSVCVSQYIRIYIFTLYIFEYIYIYIYTIFKIDWIDERHYSIDEKPANIWYMPNEYVTNQMFSVITCSHIFIILEYIIKRKRDQKKNGETGIYRFDIA